VKNDLAHLTDASHDRPPGEAERAKVAVECCFCAELSGARTAFHDLYPHIKSRVVFATPNFVVLPSLGQIAPGHLLLVPRAHVASFGELDPARRGEALVLYSALREELAERYAPVVSFEHGSPTGSVVGGCGIVHAHIHFVPLPGASKPPMPTGQGWRRSANSIWIDEAAALVASGTGYLMWHGWREVALLDAVEHVRSQYLRHHAAEVAGDVDWDWRQAGPQPELVELVEAAAPWLVEAAAF